MIRQEDVYKIGRLGKPHGVKGEIQFQFDDDVFDRVDADYLVLDMDGILVPFFMEEYRFRSDTLALVKFCDIDTQERVRELTGTSVYFPRELAEESTSEDDFSLAILVDYQVFEGEQLVGKITSIDQSTVNTLFEILTPNGEDVLIPVNPEWVEEINQDDRTIRMHLPEGLLEL